jgi:hypothetical protein
MTPEEYNQLYQLGTALERNRRSERNNEAATAAFFLLLVVILILPFWLLYKALDENSNTSPTLRFLAGVCALFLIAVIGIISYGVFYAITENNRSGVFAAGPQQAAPIQKAPAIQVAKPVNQFGRVDNNPPKKPPVFPGLAAEQIPDLAFNGAGKPIIPPSLMKGTRYLTPEGSRLGLNAEGVITDLPKLPKGAGSLTDPLARMLVDDAQQYWFFYFEYWRLYDIHAYLHHHQLDPQKMLNQQDRLTWLDLSGPNFTTPSGVTVFWAPMPG